MAPNQSKSKALKNGGIKKDGSSTKDDSAPIHQLAGPFRNLMKYRASEQCKKAFAVTS
jgi:hypothetical protein